MYSRSVPMPGDSKADDNNPIYDDSKDACNPNNFKEDDFEDEIIVSARK